ncbi:MAG: right-handed parallel beta-helix repeat-containing protein [Candidatus Bathyarchaeota archaeon]|nr:right-handed parallel beta-helix repeat-containing protein [Candidatus Bathyarchaeum sp.]
MLNLKTVVSILLVFSFVLVSFPQIEVVTAEGDTVVVPDDFPTIQAAVDAASEGDIIFVKSGTYNESVCIDRPISLVGEDPKTTTIVGDYRLNGTVVLIRHNNANITGFTVKPSAYSFSRKGIHLLHVNYCRVFGNTILDNGEGIWLYGSSENNITGNTIDGPSARSCGISIKYSPNNYICNNLVTENYVGMSITYSDGNTVYNNTIINNPDGGLVINSNGNNISNNIVSNQSTGITLAGSNNVLRANKISNSNLNFNLNWDSSWDLSDFINDIDSSNTINGKSIIYWVNKQDEKVPEDTPFLVLVNCANITVENLKLSQNMQGIILVATTNSKIQRNSVQVQKDAILLFSSTINTVNDNTLSDAGRGIHLVYSSQNTITGNAINKGSTAIRLEESNENTLNYNVISGGSSGGIDLYGSNSNTFVNNTISDCTHRALWFWDHASQNLFYLNNFVNNTKNVEEYITTYQSFPKNIWDNGTIGNFWSDYNGTDNNADDIGDTPYSINEKNQDNHPIINPVDINMHQEASTNPGLLLGVIFSLLFLAVVLIIVFFTKRLRKGVKYVT